MDQKPSRRKTPRTKVAIAWRDFYNTPQGRHAIGALFAHAGVFSQIRATDPVSAGIEIGQRNVAAWLSEMIGLQPQDYVDEAVVLERADLAASFEFQV